MKYGEDIAGMAPMIVTKLIELFYSYIAEGSGQKHYSKLELKKSSNILNPYICFVFLEDEEATFNAVQCLDTIDSVLEAVQENAMVLSQLEPITQPLILK